MSAYRDKKTGAWRYRKQIRLHDRTTERISGTSALNTKLDAERAERDHIARALDPVARKKMEVPTFDEWFNGRFWREWVIARENKPSEVESKKSIYTHRLQAVFGKLRLDAIDDACVARFRADLVEQLPSKKTRNNVLAVLSKPLRYAADVGLIARAPRIGMFKTERPEIECWTIAEYARVLAAAKEEGPEWYVAACLAGEAGLRIGEVRALRWREDVDLVAGTITVNQQTRKGVTGTPKGRTRRTVKMTTRLAEALRGLSVVRTGLVCRNADGTALRDGQTTHAVYRVYRKAGLPEREGAWHVLRHSFGTHAAMFGVNPWRLMTWMGHKRIDETMRYVHVAEDHHRELPPALVALGDAHRDPDDRVRAMLGGRGNTVPMATATGTEQAA